MIVGPACDEERPAFRTAQILRVDQIEHVGTSMCEWVPVDGLIDDACSWIPDPPTDYKSNNSSYAGVIGLSLTGTNPVETNRSDIVISKKERLRLDSIQGRRPEVLAFENTPRKFSYIFGVHQIIHYLTSEFGKSRGPASYAVDAFGLGFGPVEHLTILSSAGQQSSHED